MSSVSLVCSAHILVFIYMKQESLGRSPYTDSGIKMLMQASLQHIFMPESVHCKLVLSHALSLSDLGHLRVI